VATDDEPLLSSTDLAKRLGINTRTVSRWVQEGKLTPAYTTPGGKYRWRWSDVRQQLGLRGPQEQPE
jgi:excisionase family DNA binding protein